MLGWQLYDTRVELEQTRAEFARRLADGETAGREARALSKQNQDSLQALQAHVGALDAKLADSANQQEALESMYQELMRARDERFLADVEQAVSIASQQLQLAGNVPAALAALQSAEARLASQGRPQLLPVRKLLARDIDRLKALPTADVTGMALRLETMLGAIDSLPLGFEHTPPAQSAAKPAPAKPPVKAARAGGRKVPQATSAPEAASAANATESPGFVMSMLGDLWGEVRQLVRIERLDRPDPALLSPQQAVYLRENLRLRLLSARLALLQRDGQTFSEDVRQSRIWIERYFDVSVPAVASVLNDLRQMEAARLNVELPSLAETEAALRTLKFGRAN